MKNLGFIILNLSLVLILPLLVQAQPPEQPPPAGPIDEVKQQLEDEIVNRTEGDQNLQDQIDAEEAARMSADQSLQDQIDNIPSFSLYNSTDIEAGSKLLASDYIQMYYYSSCNEEDIAINISCYIPVSSEAKGWRIIGTGLLRESPGQQPSSGGYCVIRCNFPNSCTLQDEDVVDPMSLCLQY
jgi:hypothetical protein